MTFFCGQTMSFNMNYFIINSSLAGSFHSWFSSCLSLCHGSVHHFLMICVPLANMLCPPQRCLFILALSLVRHPVSSMYPCAPYIVCILKRSCVSDCQFMCCSYMFLWNRFTQTLCLPYLTTHYRCLLRLSRCSCSCLSRCQGAANQSE